MTLSELGSFQHKAKDIHEDSGAEWFGHAGRHTHASQPYPLVAPGHRANADSVQRDEDEE
jgi:hypothetical protein